MMFTKFIELPNQTTDMKNNNSGNYTCAIDVKHSSNGKRSLSEFESCCHFAINGGIKMSRCLACIRQQ